jgi:hypothetical protein
VDLEGLERSAYLDELERFAKSEESIAIVRLWFAGDSPQTYTDLTYEEFRALTRDEKETINNAGSAAGYVETEGKSNA